MVDLLKHNQEAYEKIKEAIADGKKRIAISHATGTGKSYLIAKLIEDRPNSRFFILSTRHNINDQFKEMFDDETLKRVNFNIYCNMPNMTKKTMESLQPDYIFLDEMHRALAKEWQKGVKALLNVYPNVKLLGLSATPIRYLDRCRNVVEELFGGNLACDMSLSQAILDGILPMARYVCGVYSYEKDAESLNKKIEKSTNSDEEKAELLKQVKVLCKNLDKGHGVSDIFKKYIVNDNEKFVVFLKDTKHLRVMKPVIEKWFLDAGFNVRLYEVHSKNVNRDKEFLAFKDDKEDGIVKACLSVSMLSEGLHGDISGVIMLRETISPNLYFQMIGRAFACGKKNIPLIFDLVANSQFISDAVDNFPNELRGEIEKRKKECEKEGKEYEVGFDVDEFIVMDEFMDVVSGFRGIEKQLKGREWTDEEIEILKKWYPIEGIKVKDRLDNRTKQMIFSKVSDMGLKSLRAWTEHEVEILKKYYPIEGARVANRLNNKSKATIQSMAHLLKIKKNSRCWSVEELEILKEYYPIEGTKVKNRLNNKGKQAIMNKAKSLDINYVVSIFTDEEDKIIKHYYPIEGRNVYKRLSNKTAKQCASRAAYLKVNSLSNVWTDKDYEILKEYYPRIGCKVSTMINKSNGACMTMASKLGIKRENKKI